MNSNKKPLLLIFPFNYLSHYTRCIELARHLRPYFEIEFAASDKYNRFVTAEGFGTFNCKAIDAEQVLSYLKAFDFSWINEKTLEPVFSDQARILRERRPTAVLGDSSLTLKMAAEKTGVFYISLMNGYMSKYYARPRALSRTHPAYQIVNRLPARIAELVTRKGEQFMFKKVHRPFNAFRQRNNLSLQNSYLDELEGDINLICDLDELFPQGKLPANYYIIPPLCYGLNPGAGIASKPKRSIKKTIFVSMGSTGDWSSLAFLNNPAFAIYRIITAADKQQVLHAPHITSLDFANMHEWLPFTDLVICHGGNGTIYQALLHGVPLLCKTNHFEQEWNVEALKRAGLGRSIDAIENLPDHKAIIAEWIDKKGTGACTTYQNKLTSIVESLPNHARQVSWQLPGQRPALDEVEMHKSA